MEVKYDPILGQLREADSGSSTPVIASQLLLPALTAGLYLRIIARTGWVYAIDEELLVNGFITDIEDVSWRNVGGLEIVII